MTFDAKDVFTQHLFVLTGDKKTKSPDTLMISGLELNLQEGDIPYYPILPIQKSILEKWGAKFIAQNLSFHQNESSINVKLSLTDSVTESSYSVETVYSWHDDIVFMKPSNCPSVQVWPNFTHPDLNSHYYYYTSHNQAGHAFYTLPYHPEGSILEYARYNLSKQVIETLIQGKISRESQTQDKHIDLELARFSHYPEALLCFEDSLSEHYIGCLLISSPHQIELNHGIRAVIGVDLGTSSTSVYMNCQHRVQPVVLENPNFTLFAHLIRNKNTNYACFLPNAFEQTPIMNIYEIFHETASPTLLLEGNIKFIHGLHNVSLNKPSIKTDLNWKSIQIQGNGSYLKAFLSQLCLQSTMYALQQGARDIEFRFSFPVTFSSRESSVVNAMLGNSIMELQSIYKYISYNSHASLKTHIANMKFVMTGVKESPMPKFHSGVVILDLGEETTDISIVQGKQGIFKFLTSLKIAGRSLFIDAILKHQEVFFESFDIPCPLNIQNALQHNPYPKWVYSQIDALIKDKEASIMGILPQRHEKLKPMIDEMAIGIAGIFYYIGTVIEALQERIHQGKDLVDDQNNVLQAVGEPIYAGDRVPLFYIAGNGAKIFDWFTNGQPYSQAGGYIYDKLFERALKHDVEAPFYGSQASRTEIGIYPTSSGFGKGAEVAIGLVLENDFLILHNQDIDPIYVAGEDFLLSSHTASYKDLLNAAQMPNVDIDNIDQTQIARFLDIINLELHLGLTGDKKNQLLKDIQRHISYHLSHIYKHPNQVQDECALFIQEIKALIYFLSKSVKDP